MLLFPWMFKNVNVVQQMSHRLDGALYFSPNIRIVWGENMTVQIRAIGIRRTGDIALIFWCRQLFPIFQLQ